MEAGLAGAAAQGGAHRDRPPDSGQLARKHNGVRPALLPQNGRLESSHVAQQLQNAPPDLQSRSQRQLHRKRWCALVAGSVRPGRRTQAR